MKIQEVAKNYLRHGWSVIPVTPETKKPSTKWMEFTERKANPLEVQSWFADKPSNIGIVTGSISNLVAIDIDKPELYDQFIKQYPTHLIQKTASGGYHLLYKYAGKDIGNSISRLASGIDVRGNHGFIVTYPSTVRLASGGLGAYHWIEQGDPSPLPQALHDTIVAELGQQTNSSNPSVQQDDAKNLLFQVIANGFTEGMHNNQVKDLARYLYRTGMNEAAIVDLLGALNMKDATPLAPSEINATIKSGIGYEKKRLGAKEGKGSRQEFDAISAIDLKMAYEEQSNDYLIEDWIPRNSLMVITAPPESYKTWIAMEVAVQVALGSNSTGFLGGEWKGPANGEPVLIVQQEDNKAKLVERYETILRSKSINAEYLMLEDADGSVAFQTAWDAPVYWHTKAMLNFDEPDSIKELENKIKEHHIKLVIIDPLYSLAAADDFFAGMARGLMPIKELRDKYGVTFIFVHHNKKGTKGAKSIDDMDREGMFGSQLLNGAFEGFLFINKLASGERIIKRVGKAFDGSKEPYVIDFDISTHYTFDQETQTGEPSHYKVSLKVPNGMMLNKNMEAMRDALLELDKGVGTRSAILKAAGLSATNSAAIKDFTAMLSIGIITEVEGELFKNKYPLYQLSPAS